MGFVAPGHGSQASTFRVYGLGFIGFIKPDQCYRIGCFREVVNTIIKCTLSTHVKQNPRTPQALAVAFALALAFALHSLCGRLGFRVCRV